MERLTTNKDVSEMSMIELAHNSCYAKDIKARYRDYETDIDARELAIKLLDKYADIPNEFTCDEDFDDFILDSTQYGMDDILGMIAIFYRNLWAMADLRERLKEYEDLEEQGKLPKLPCAVGDTAWLVGDKRVLDYKVSGFSMDDSGISIIFIEKEIDGKIYSRSIDYTEYGKTVFLTKEKAEAALK